MSFSFNSLECAKESEKTGNSIISEGPHRLVVEKIELKQTRAGTGEYYNCLIRSLETNESGFYMFNVSNPSVKAQEIGQREFSYMYVACGLTGEINEFTAEDVKGKPFMADVSQKEQPGFATKNVFRNFRPVTQMYAPGVSADTDVPF